MKELFGIRLL